MLSKVRLAAAGMADDRDELALLDAERDVVQHFGLGRAAGEGLVDVVDLEIGIVGIGILLSWPRCRG